MTSHRKPRRSWIPVAAVVYLLAVTALVLVLSGCKGNTTRKPDQREAVRESPHTCRCGIRDAVR